MIQEPEYIGMLRQMTKDQFMELVHNIGVECANRDTATQDYCDLASHFMSVAIGLHERGGCHIALQIQHPSWDHVHLYSTGEGVMNMPLDAEDEEDGDSSLDLGFEEFGK